MVIRAEVASAATAQDARPHADVRRRVGHVRDAAAAPDEALPAQAARVFMVAIAARLHARRHSPVVVLAAVPAANAGRHKK